MKVEVSQGTGRTLFLELNEEQFQAAKEWCSNHEVNWEFWEDNHATIVLTAPDPEQTKELKALLESPR